MRGGGRGVGSALLLATVFVVGCGGGDARTAPGDAERPEPTRDAIPVAASVPPAAWLAERIGGERVEVTTVLPPGRSPHAFEPSPRELAALARARLVVVVGHPALPFEERLLAAAGRDGEPRVVAMSEGVVLLPGPENGDPAGGHDGHAAGEPSETDPHVWLDPQLMKATAARVTDALASIDPGHTAGYRGRLDGLLAEIDALDREIRAALEGVAGRSFLAYHPSWGYFAARYGLVQEAVESEGKEPGPRELAERVKRARRRGVRVVFVQRSDAGRGAGVLAEEIGAEVVALDELAHDWPGALRRAAAEFAAALGDDAEARP